MALAVAVPAGFDTGLLAGALTWSGTYTAPDGSVDSRSLGSGQDAGAGLDAGTWSITATLTERSGATRSDTASGITVAADCTNG